MAPFGYARKVRHPYSHDPRYKHFQESYFHHPAYSAAAVPFAWMMKNSDDGIPDRAKAYKIDFRPELEPDLEFDKLWVQERRNQLAMLDTFFGAITPEESLVFFYAKRTPLTDDGRRVIVGMGRVLKVDPSVEYIYEKGAPSDAMRCVLWERNLHHSIRPDIKDGFLLPYHELIDLAEKDPSIDVSSLVLHAPEEQWDAFSMGTEHVTHDQAITVLLACASLLERLERVVPGNWSAARGWVDTQLNRIWRLRGAFPGLGSALTAFGLTHGTLVAHAVGQQLHADGSQEVRDPWPLVEKVLHEPTLLALDLAATIGSTAAKLWGSLKPERRALLKLLARFEITADQATRWFVTEERTRVGITATDAEILANPYICFEDDRGRIDPISAAVIDRGLFPDATVATAVPLPDPSRCREAIDPRRGRALMISTLDRAAGEGHTLLPQSWLVQRVRDLDVSPQCAIGADWVEAFGTFLKARIAVSLMADGTPAWQLQQYAKSRDLISARVKRRLTGKRHPGEHDWRALIDQQLPPFAAASDPETEELARVEKAKALEEIFRSRFSVLIGPAGTGKTSLLTALLSLPSVAAGGVLLLAPTGKARVQMQRRAKNAQAYTLAQFLLALGRYDPLTGAYRVTDDANRERGFKTVVIDECSMLTEDQLAATLDSIETTSVERLILVGDPRQLPPIGAGRPFVDIVRYLNYDSATANRQTAAGYAELKMVRRQTEQSVAAGQPPAARDDIILSRWFGGEAPDPGADEAWDRLAIGKAIGIRAVRWEGDADLQTTLLAEVKATTRSISQKKGFDDEGDDTTFEISLGGRPFKEVVYFNLSRLEKDAEGAERRSGGGADAETWQILSPVRAGETGVDGLNRWLQKTFRQRARVWATPNSFGSRKVFKPLGPQGILYGDKVINLINKKRSCYPKVADSYLANGEIGIVIGQYKGAKASYKGSPWEAQVEFSSQLGYHFSFQARDFGQDGESPLELAYALTIHKAQGSEFGTTFIVIPNPCRLLSRELLYTALTRQREEVVLFHQGDLRALLNLSLSEHSETARRLTNLFSDPKPVEHLGSFLEEGLIHRTTRGELVRSKSEVIIANLLHGLGITYAYEQPFTGQDGSVRYPDFTIEDAETGRRVFLEHLGLLSEPAYRRRWLAKLNWYRSQGVLPEEEGDGDAGILMTTTEEKGIDSADIEQRLRMLLGL
ncbi:ATP-dependent RecD-like DNA helicase [Tabrizicola sp.]|uniref:ATP-dependent DNA helicase n=1 Tax=Tabrizicola sp. TaxID=2005166 RepID=UPI001A60FDF4|nr:ATP-dependent RecD-like DNA helicase [Tabrizicola sp.]MBL9063255.1 AAA family ATPase [Tabrizicola sp.]